MAVEPAADTSAQTRAEGLTVDRLSARTGIPSRTIRFYQTQGVLPPPKRRGRVAVYGDDHIERLRLIALLQDRGLRLSAIRRLVQQGGPESLSVSRWLGLDERLRTPWFEEQPQVLGEAELARVLAAHPSVSADDLLGIGLLTSRAGATPTYVVPSPALFELTLALERAGVDLPTAGEAGAIVRRFLADAADRMIQHFAGHAGTGFGRHLSPDELSAALDALRTLGVEAVRLIFAQEMERALRALAEGREQGNRRRRR